MKLLLWILIAWKYMTATPAVSLICSVNQSDDHTTYTIQITPDVSGVQCYFSWTNKTDNVLANEEQAIPKLVLNYSSRALTILGCLDVVHYEGTCGPKWEKQTANCTSSCVKKSGLAKSGDEDKFINDIRETSMIVTIVATVATVVIIVGLILAALCCIWKRSPVKGEKAAGGQRTGQQDACESEPLQV